MIETTHLKVQQSHTLGVSSFVLSSETVGENKGDNAIRREEIIKVTDVDGKETIIPVQIQGDLKIDEEELERRLKEVGRFDDEAWNNYHNVTKQAIKGFI